MAEMKYKQGDWVKIVDEYTRTLYGSDAEILGRVARIYSIGSGWFSIENNSKLFLLDYIEKRLTEKEALKILQKEEEVLYELEEKYEIAISPKKIMKLASNVFGEERVMVEREGVNDVHLKIHFPSLTLTNSKGEEHTIEDLYIKFHVNLYLNHIKKNNEDSYKCNITFSGIRTKWSLKEYESGYIHSHLPGHHFNFGFFCLGASNYAFLIEKLKMSLREEDWMLLFYGLEHYLNWESLEGGPHRKMKEIKYHEQVPQHILEEELNRIVHGVPKCCWDCNSTLSIIPNKKELREYFDDNSTVKSDSLYNINTGRKKAEEASREITSNHYVSFQWKGKEIYPVVEYEDEKCIKNGGVGMGVMRIYCDLLNKKASKFLKIYNYGKRKERNREKTFGEGGVRKQTYTHCNEGVKG